MYYPSPYCYNKFNFTQSRRISCKHATHACLYVFADIVVFAPIKCCLPTLTPGKDLGRNHYRPMPIVYDICDMVP